MVLRGKRCGAPQQPQARVSTAFSTAGRKMGQERGETCLQPAQPCTGVLAGLECTGLERPSPTARDGWTMQEAGAGVGPSQDFGDVTRTPHLWDNLGPRHCTVLPETLLPSQGWTWVQCGGVRGRLRQLPFVPTRYRGGESPPRPHFLQLV